MTLRIALRDGERLIVNGAVVRAIGRTELAIENRVAILRGREIIEPDDATTPARRLYHACMLSYIDESGRAAHQDRVVRLLGDLLGALETERARTACLDFARLIALGDYYRALGVCRSLIDYEQAALARGEKEPAI